VLPGEDARLIGTDSTVVLLSEDTARKQKLHHSKMNAADYVLVQDAIDRGERIRQGPRKLAYVLDDAEGGVAVVKATKTGVEVYLVSSWKFGGDAKERARELARLRRKAFE
jgi:hypothetical protein